MANSRESMQREARIALSEKMVTQKAVDAVFGLLGDKEPRATFADLLLQLGHINEGQHKRLLELRNAGAPPSDDPEGLFGEAVVAQNLATIDQVNRCLQEQADLAAKNIFKNLGEILVERGFLKADQVQGLIEEQDKVLMACPKCSERYNVLRRWTGGAQCPVDGATLGAVRHDTKIVGVAATIGAEAARPGSPIGTEVGGCTILELIARGSMGVVYKARHVGLNRIVAVKLLESVSQNPNLLKRLLFEARAAAKLDHPNIVQVYDVGFQRGFFFIVMQLLKGQTLEDRMTEVGSMPIAEALEIARQIARGLEAAHAKGIVHRDLKPSNVVLTDDGHARLADFGLAQDVETPDEHAGTVVGTPFYMSPEQWLGHKADERSDLYSLGVVLFRMATGKLPFAGRTVVDLMHQHLKEMPPPADQVEPLVSAGLSAVIRKMMTKAPRRRYATAKDFVEDLERVIRGDDPHALAEFGKLVPCGFCEALNPAQERKCKVCGESLQRNEGPLELQAQSDEFKCPGCGELVRLGLLACGGCKREFCLKCHNRFAMLKGYCELCVSQAPKKWWSR